MKQTRKAFTLIELLVVVAIIALLVSILMPALGRAKEMAKRAQCGANMHALGIGVVVYQNANRGLNPVVGLRDHTDAYFGRGFYSAHRLVSTNIRWYREAWNWWIPDGPATTTGGCLWQLVLHADIDPKAFICPSDAKAEEINMELAFTLNTNIEGFLDLNDFQTMLNLSYGYNDPFNSLLDDSAGSSLVIMADANPKFDNANGTGKPDGEEPYNGQRSPQTDDNANVCRAGFQGDWTDKSDKTNPLHASGNSKNHGHEMQTVLFADGHVKQHQTPRAGAAQDNIYTYWGNRTCAGKSIGLWDTIRKQFRDQGSVDKKDTYIGY